MASMDGDDVPRRIGLRPQRTKPVTPPRPKLRIKRGLIQDSLPSNYCITPFRLKQDSADKPCFPGWNFLRSLILTVFYGIKCAFADVCILLSLFWLNFTRTLGQLFRLVLWLFLRLWQAIVKLRYYRRLRGKSKSFSEEFVFVLDLDQTLVYTTDDPPNLLDLEYFSVQNCNGGSCYVYKRPHLETFLSSLARIGRLVMFTAAERSYAEQVLTSLNRKGYFSGAFYRDSCVRVSCGYLKDIKSLGYDLARTVVIDDTPSTYRHNPENAMPIPAWHKEQKGDKALLKILDGLCKVSFEGDIRLELAKLNKTR